MMQIGPDQSPALGRKPKDRLPGHDGKDVQRRPRRTRNQPAQYGDNGDEHAVRPEKWVGLRRWASVVFIPSTFGNLFFMFELLIIKPSSLGDIVHGLQVATSFKAQRKDLRISWVVREMFAPLVRACEAVDQVYVFERNAGTAGFMKLTKELRKTPFDAVFDFQGLLRTGLMTSRVRAKRKIGRTDAREGATLFYRE